MGDGESDEAQRHARNGLHPLDILPGNNLTVILEPL